MALSGCFVASAPQPQPAEGYLFSFWNVENLFDDKVNHYRDPDKAYDEWFAEDEKARKQKYDNLARVLTGLNGGRGPTSWPSPNWRRRNAPWNCCATP